MNLTTYTFVSRWQVSAPYDQVFDVLADIEHYGRWWDEIRSVVPVDDDSARVEIRSRLPYTLRCTLTRTEQDRGTGRLTVAIGGDLEGEAGWSLSAHDDVVVMEYEQHVTTRLRAMRWLAPLARPAFGLNHRLMMRNGRDGLARHLRTLPVSWRGDDTGGGP